MLPNDPTSVRRDDTVPLDHILREEVCNEIDRYHIMNVRETRDFGEALRSRRRAVGLSQQDVASVIGVNRRVISELERGKATVQLKIALEAARAVGLDVALLPRD